MYAILSKVSKWSIHAEKNHPVHNIMYTARRDGSRDNIRFFFFHRIGYQ